MMRKLNTRVEYNQSLNKTIGVIRAVQIILLLLMVILLVTGPGFHLRQRWEAAISKRDTVTRIICGNSSASHLNATDGCKSGEENALDQHIEDAMVTVVGYYGSLPISNWLTILHFEGQIFCLMVVLIAMAGTFMLMLASCQIVEFDVEDKRRTILSFHMAMALCMIVVMGVNLWYSNCGGYGHKTTATFKRNINKLQESTYTDGELNGKLSYKERVDIAVQCTVAGYAFAAVVGLLSAVLFFIDFKITNKMTKRQFPVSVELGSRGPSTTKHRAQQTKTEVPTYPAGQNENDPFNPSSVKQNNRKKCDKG